MPRERTTPRPCAWKAKYPAEPELCLHRGHSQHGSRVPILISTIPNFPKVVFLTKTFTPQLLPLGRRLKGGSHQAVNTRPPMQPFTLWVHAPSCLLPCSSLSEHLIHQPCTWPICLRVCVYMHVTSIRLSTRGHHPTRHLSVWSRETNRKER